MTSRLNYTSGRDLVIDTCDRLRIARLKAGIEQEEMAEILGVSSSTISNWEHGRTVPKNAFISAWAQVTGFNMASLLDSADAEKRLAHTVNRHGPGKPETPGQTVSQLPRLDSNQEPCGCPATFENVAVTSRNVTGSAPPENVCPDQNADNCSCDVGLSRCVSWPASLSANKINPSNVNATDG